MNTINAYCHMKTACCSPQSQPSTIVRSALLAIVLLLISSSLGYAQPNLNANGEMHTLSYDPTNKVQEWKVPANITSGRIYLEVSGADGGIKKNYGGGSGYRARGGEGATMGAWFEIGQANNQIPPGASILFIIGERGENKFGLFPAQAGGGGGSGIVFQRNPSSGYNLLIVAGGGGGGAADCCLISKAGSTGKPFECVWDTQLDPEYYAADTYCYDDNNDFQMIGRCRRAGTLWDDNTDAGYYAGTNLDLTPCGDCVGHAGWPGAERLDIFDVPVRPTGGEMSGCDNLAKGGFGFGSGSPGRMNIADESSGGGGYTIYRDGGGGSYINDYYSAVLDDESRVEHSITDDPKSGNARYQIIPAPIAICNNYTVNLPESGTQNFPVFLLASSSSTYITSEYLVTRDVATQQIILNLNCSDLGTQLVTVELEGSVSGYTGRCNAHLTVTDQSPPTANCQDITVYLDENGQVEADAGLVDNGSTDNCSNNFNLYFSSLNQTQVFDCSHLGTTPVNNMIVQDQFGNRGYCDINITVRDTLPPVASCRNLTAYLTNDDPVVISPQQINDNSTVSCSIDGFQLDETIFDCGQAGDNTVTLSVTATNGKVSTCEATITIVDEAPPHARCQDVTVQLDNNGQASVGTGQLNNGSSDNCGTVDDVIMLPNVQLEIQSDRWPQDINWEVTSPDGNTVYYAKYYYPSESLVIGQPEYQITHFIENITLPAGDYQLRWHDFLDGGFECDFPGENFYRLTDQQGNELAYGECFINWNTEITDFTIQTEPEITNVLNVDCSDEGSRQVLLSVSDEAGLRSTCLSTLTVAPPASACPPTEVQLPASGELTLASDQLDLAATNACDEPIQYLFRSATLQLEIAADGYNDHYDWKITSEDGQTTYASGDDYPVNFDNSQPTEQLQRLAQKNHFVIDIPFPRNGCFNFIWNDDSSDGFSCAEDNAVYFYRLTTYDGWVLASGECEDIGAGSTTTFCIYNTSGEWQYDLEKVLSCEDVGLHYVTLGMLTSSGKVTDCETTITVKPPPPVAECLQTIVDLDENNQATIKPEDVINPYLPCGGFSMVDFTEITYTCDAIGTRSLDVTLSDIYGGSDQCTATVTLRDYTPPQANCQDITVYLDDDGQVEVDASFVNNGSTDNCNGISDLYFPSFNHARTFDCNEIGTNTIYDMIVEDLSGNLDYCTVNITILDGFPPIAQCQDLTIEVTNQGPAVVTPQQINDNSTDGCSVDGLELDQTSFDCGQAGDHTLTLTVTDVNGNFSTCEATVTVVDETTPTVQCQDVTVQLDVSGQVSITTEQIDNGSSAACGSGIASLDRYDFGCLDIGDNTVTFTLSAPNGLSSSCEATVTVRNENAPVTQCRDVTVQLNASGQASVSEEQVDNNSYSTCGATLASLNQHSFDCNDVGDNTVTLTLSAPNGLSSSCEATVTVRNENAPVAQCQDITVQLNASGQASVSEEQIDNNSYSTCGGTLASLNQHSFDCNDVGDNTVTLTLSAPNGLSSSCEATVTVHNENAPVAQCQDVTVQLNASGQASVSEEQIDNNSYSTCGGAVASLNQYNFDCLDIGDNIVTLTLSAPNGLSSSCEATVTVRNENAPVAQCQDITVQLNASGQINVSEEQIDNNSYSTCGGTLASLNQHSFDCNDVGDNTVTLTLSAPNGLSSSCEATVTVHNENAPVAQCQDITVQLNASGQVNVSEEQIDNNSYSTCGGAVANLDRHSFDCSDAGDNTVTLTLSAPNELSSSCEARVTVVDNQFPTITCPMDINVDNDPDQCGALVDFEADASDNCTLAPIDYTLVSGSLFPIGSTMVTATATDASGNSTSCNFTVNVSDTESPVLNCNGLNATVSTDPGACSSLVDLSMPTATDNCVASTLDFRYRLVDNNNNNAGPWQQSWTDYSQKLVTLETGRYKVRWRTTDAAGSTAFCRYFIEVKDEEAPVINCADVEVLFNGEEFIDLHPSDLATVVDNCGVESLTLDIDRIYCDELGDQVIVTALAVDVYGSSSLCTSVVDVLGLPCDWGQEPDGVDCVDGSDTQYDQSTGVFTVTSTDCYNSITTNTDEYAFAQYQLCGDGMITAQVTSITGFSGGWAGVTMRNSNDPQDMAVSLLTNLAQNHRQETRISTGSHVASSISPSFNRHWLRIQRIGNGFRGFTSSNGITWFSKFNLYVPMDQCIEIGLVVNSSAVGTSNSATFANVSISGGDNLQLAVDPDGPDVSEQYNKSQFSLYPNPTSGPITIQLGDFLDQEGVLELLDTHGRLVQPIRQGILFNREEELDLSLLANGVYFLRLRLPDGTVQTERVILQAR